MGIRGWLERKEQDVKAKQAERDVRHAERVADMKANAPAKPGARQPAPEVEVFGLTLDQALAATGYPQGVDPYYDDERAERWYVAGTHLRQPLLRAIWNQCQTAGIDCRHMVFGLFPEPDNAADRHAISVTLFSRMIGYVPDSANLAWMHGRIRNQYPDGLPVYGRIYPHDNGAIVAAFYYRKGSLR